MVVWAMIAPPPQSRAQVAEPSLYLRGGAYLVVRLPSDTVPVDQIRVFDSNEASRAYIPLLTPRAFITTTLSAELGTALMELQGQWCVDPPRIDPAASIPYYEIAVRCEGFATQSVQLPLEQLPPAIRTLIDTMPAAPTKEP